jgi:DNA-binding Lrp family transcriptional regulator
VGESDTPRDISRYTVPEAAQALGISPEAVRNRLSRGTLKSVKEAGTVYVLLETDRTRHTGDRPNDRSTDTPPGLVGQMQARIDSLERQLEQANERDRENRRIIAALTSRIPAIEAPPEARDSPQTVEEEPERAGPRPATGEAQEGTERRPWWRRAFGG